MPFSLRSHPGSWDLLRATSSSELQRMLLPILTVYQVWKTSRPILSLNRRQIYTEARQGKSDHLCEDRDPPFPPSERARERERARSNVNKSLHVQKGTYFRPLRWRCFLRLFKRSCPLILTLEIRLSSLRNFLLRDPFVLFSRVTQQPVNTQDVNHEVHAASIFVHHVGSRAG
ncbi:hypothetical protein DL98DRAFT_87221 [Cadophora sp. DSE1049]|nr:hypothetical protein DL98DRAFT_87221 [Cadophora sp. DSE1049]